MNPEPERLLRYLITTGEARASNFNTQKQVILDAIAGAVQAGIEMVQLREKMLDARRLFELAEMCAGVVRGRPTRLFVNERFDIALASGADGVHLSSTSVPVNEVRMVVGRDLIIGVSTHSADEVIAAQISGADFALFGPVFETPGKPVPKGLAALADVCGKVSGFPVLAIGGVDGETIEALRSAGAAGYAAIRYLNDLVKK